MGKRKTRRSTAAPAVEEEETSGRSWKTIDEDDLLHDEVDAFHSSKDKILMGEDEDESEEDNEPESVLALNVDDSDDEEDEEQDDEDDDADDLDDAQKQFLREHQASKRRVETADMHGNDEDIGEKELKRSLEGWGRDKKQFYSTDYVDPDYDMLDEEKEAAVQEGQEALMLQRRQAQQLEDEDFGLSDGSQDENEEEGEEDMQKIERDLSSLSEKELSKYVKRSLPELAVLHTLAEKLSSERDETLCPLLSMLGLQPSISLLSACGLSNGIVRYLHYRRAIVDAYLLNIDFYKLLVAEQVKLLDDHPVAETLLNLQKMLVSTDTLQATLSLRLKSALAKLEETASSHVVSKSKSSKMSLSDFGDEPEIETKSKRKGKRTQEEEEQEEEDEQEAENGAGPGAKKKKEDKAKDKKTQKKIKKIKSKKHFFEDEADDFDEDEALDLYNQMANRKKQAPVEDDGREAQAEGTRQITYDIRKNKGLLPSRKKEYRNPRVRNKNKFAKATKRRKGAVREAVKEIPKYTGEATGIRRTLTKSTKLA